MNAHRDERADHEAQALAALESIALAEAIAEAGTVDELEDETLRRRALDEFELDYCAETYNMLDIIALEVRISGEKIVGGEWEMTRFTIVTGTGGPHTEVSMDYDGSNVVARSFGWFGADEVRQHGDDCPYLAGWLEGIAE